MKLRRNFGQTRPWPPASIMPAANTSSPWTATCSTIPPISRYFWKRFPRDTTSSAAGAKIASTTSGSAAFPSRCANWLMAKFSGVDIHDFGTTFKAYRREILEQVPLYGELHRFIPALASWHGASICEVPIQNVNRERGVSHYGISRTFRVFFDLITIRFLLRYLSRPLHFFGTVGMLSIMAGSAIALWLLVQKLLHQLRCHGKPWPADDFHRGADAGWLEHAGGRLARRNAGPPLPRAHSPRPILG